MVQLAGIIHPSAFQITELIGTMSPSFCDTSQPHPFQFFRYKNLELGIWGDKLATNEQKSIWILADGNIHNSAELKSELKKMGFSVSSDSTQELVLCCYEAWGEQFIKKITGEFAIALFDEELETLYLFRDRLGKKNLYWVEKGESWLFASEIKGLLATGLVPQTPSTVGLGSYLYFGYIPQDISSVKGVNKLLPGHFLKIQLNRQFAIEKYWSLSNQFEKKEPISQEQSLERFSSLFHDSVSSALSKKDKCGLIDTDNLGSAALSWQTNHLSGQEKVDSFSLSPDELDPEQGLRELVQIVWHLDEPVADPYIMQAWYLAKKAAGKVDTLLADLGWEETLAGHKRYFSSEKIVRRPLSHRLAALPERLLTRFLIPLCDLCRSRAGWRVLRNVDIDRGQIIYLIQLALFRGSRRKKVSPLLSHYFDPEIFTQRFHRLGVVEGTIDPLLYLDSKTELPNQLLFQYERLLAPFNLKLVAPFLDHSLIQFLAQTPEGIKAKDNVPAALLNDFLKKVAPEKSAPKGPEKSFIDRWRLHPHLREVFMLLEKGLLVEEGLISPKWLRHYLSYSELFETTFRQLWALLVLEIWFRLFIDKPVGSQPLDISAYDFLK